MCRVKYPNALITIGRAQGLRAEKQEDKDTKKNEFLNIWNAILIGWLLISERTFIQLECG